MDRMTQVETFFKNWDMRQQLARRPIEIHHQERKIRADIMAKMSSCPQCGVALRHPVHQECWWCKNMVTPIS